MEKNYKGNLTALIQKKEEKLAEVIGAVDEPDGYEYELEYGANGDLTVKLADASGCYYLSGRNNPYLDALQYAVGVLDDGYYRYTLFGAGLLYEAEAMLKLREDVEITVVEQDPFLLALLFNCRDVSGVLHDSRFHLVFAPYEDYLKKVTEGDCLLIRSQTIRHLGDTAVAKTLSRYNIQFTSIREQRWAMERNYRMNIMCEQDTLDFDTCQSIIKGRKVYFVAAGPSLDLSMEKLRDRPKDSLIICVGTVAKKLIRENITPDFIVITDADDLIEKQVGDLVLPNTVLLYLATANCYAVTAFQGKKCVLFQKGFDKAEQKAKELGVPLIHTGGSVSTTALDLCIQCEAREVICLGLDLAYTNGTTHARDTLQVQSVTDDYKISLRSVVGGEVATSGNLEIYHHWIENRLLENDARSIAFTNFSNGAFIAGMNNIGLR